MIECVPSCLPLSDDESTNHTRRSLATCEVPGFASKPTFIAGCSLGGCIVVNAIHQRPGLFRGAVLLAPMLSLEKASRHGLNPYLRPLAGLISWLAPTAAVAATTRNTLYPHLQARACVVLGFKVKFLGPRPSQAGLGQCQSGGKACVSADADPRRPPALLALRAQGRACHERAL